MQVFQTAGLPPSSGSTIFPNIGSATNTSAALVKSVAPKRGVSSRLPVAAVRPADSAMAAAPDFIWSLLCAVESGLGGYLAGAK